MAFEIQLLVFAAVLPLGVALIGALLSYQLQRLVPKPWWRWCIALTQLIWVVAFLVSSSRISLLEYVEADHYRKLPWFVLLAYALGLLCCSREDWMGSVAERKSSPNDGMLWLARCTGLCIAGWWLVPRGAGWEDTIAWQPVWMLLAGLGATWNWWCMTAVRQRIVPGHEATETSAEEKNIGWQLWIGIGALLGVAGLAGLSLASLAESLLTVAAIAVGVCSVGHFSKSKWLTNLSEAGVAAAISGGTVLAMAYPSSAVPKPVYIAMMLVPSLVSLVDAIAHRLGCSSLIRLLFSFIVTACVVGGLLGWVLANEPAEDW